MWLHLTGIPRNIAILEKPLVTMGGGSGLQFKIPDYKQYKVEGNPELEWTQKTLAAKGLKDPWLRNYVWRYQYWPGFGKSAMITVFRGFKWAAGLMVITVAIDKAFGISASKHHHGDHH